MTPLAKTGLVLAGYLAAILAAWAVVEVHMVATQADRAGSDGMYAFGDSLYFLWALAIAAVPATGAGLFFLRPYPRFWTALSAAALLVATTGVAALVAFFSKDGLWSALSVLRILLAPVCAITFLAAAVFAPNRGSRFALGAATLIEGAVFSGVAVSILLASR